MKIISRFGNQLREAHNSFLLISLVFGLIFVLMTPPLWGTDETSHFARVYQLSQGQVLPDLGKSHYGGYIPKNLDDLNSYVKTDLLDNVNNRFARKDVDSVAAYHTYLNSEFSSIKKQYTWTASYSPVAYAGPIVGTTIGNLFNLSVGMTIMLARIFSLVFYSAIVWSALKILASYKIRWLFFVVALFPISVFQASVITADSMANSLAFLFAALFFKIIIERHKKPRSKLLYLLALTAILLPLAKVNYVLLSTAVLFIPINSLGTKKIATLYRLIVTLTSFVVGAVWTKIMSSPNAPISQRPDGLSLDSSAQVAWILHEPMQFLVVCIKSLIYNADSYLDQMTILIGWNYVTIPLAFICLLTSAMLLSALNARSEIKLMRPQVALAALVSLVGIGSIFLALYISFNPVSYGRVDGVQGRYFLPFLIPLVAFVVAWLPIKVEISDKVAPYLFGSVASICLVASALYYYVITYV